MKGIKIFALPAVLSLSLTGCFLDDDSDPLPSPPPPPPPPTVVNASVQVVHTSIDAPDVNVLANGDTVIEGLPFGEASEVLSLPPAMACWPTRPAARDRRCHTPRSGLSPLHLPGR